MPPEIPGFTGVTRDMMLTGLAESPLARDLPQSRFKVDTSPLAAELDSDEAGDQQIQINDDITLVRRLLQASGLPKEREKGEREGVERRNNFIQSAATKKTHLHF